MMVKELKKKNNMGYAPYKMLGHTLPGIKQRPSLAKLKAFGTKDSDMPEKVSTSPGSGLNFAAVGSSPNKGWFKNIGKSIGGAIKGIGGSVGNAVGAIKDKMAAKKQAQAEASAAAADGSDHTHAEFAELDEAMQGGGGAAPAVDPQTRPMVDAAQKAMKMKRMSQGPFGVIGGVGNSLDDAAGMGV